MSHSRHSSLSGLSGSLGGGLRQSRALREPRAFPDTSAERLRARKEPQSPPLALLPPPPQAGGRGHPGRRDGGRDPAAPRRMLVFQGPTSCAGCISEPSRVLPKAWALLCRRCFQAPLFHPPRMALEQVTRTRPLSHTPGGSTLRRCDVGPTRGALWEGHSLIPSCTWLAPLSVDKSCTNQTDRLAACPTSRVMSSMSLWAQKCPLQGTLGPSCDGRIRTRQKGSGDKQRAVQMLILFETCLNGLAKENNSGFVLKGVTQSFLMFDSFDPLSTVEEQGDRNVLNVFRCQEEDWLTGGNILFDLLKLRKSIFIGTL